MLHIHDLRGGALPAPLPPLQIVSGGGGGDESSGKALPGETFRGRVAFIVPVIDEATRTAKVRLEFPNPNGVLHAGRTILTGATAARGAA